MPELLQSLDGVGRGLVPWLLTITLWTGALLLVARVLDHGLRQHMSAAWRLPLYGLVLARLLLPPTWESPLSPLSAFTVHVEDGSTFLFPITGNASEVGQVMGTAIDSVMRREGDAQTIIDANADINEVLARALTKSLVPIEWSEKDEEALAATLSGRPSPNDGNAPVRH